MKRIVMIVVPLLIVSAVGYAFSYFWQSANAPATDTRVMSIESYVTQNISDLSPEKEVLGGTFYITSIEVDPGEGADGTGVVSYEDGHNAYTADFSYEASEFSGIRIKSFIIRQ